MSILSMMKNVNKTVAGAGRVPMTEVQVEQCKAAIRKRNLGYNVQPNSFDVATPYRVAINYDNKWSNFGNFTDANVAAAVGGLVSVAYFGSELAKVGEFDEAAAEAHPEFVAWLADERNAAVIAQATGKSLPVHQSAAQAGTGNDNPF